MDIQIVKYVFDCDKKQAKVVNIEIKYLSYG